MDALFVDEFYHASMSDKVGAKMTKNRTVGFGVFCCAAGSAGVETMIIGGGRGENQGG